MKIKEMLGVCVDELWVTVLDEANQIEVYEGTACEMEENVDGIGECEIIKIDNDCNGGNVWTIKEYVNPRHTYTARVKITGYVYVNFESTADEQEIRDAIDHEIVWNISYGDLEDTDTEYIDAEDENGHVIELD